MRRAKIMFHPESLSPIHSAIPHLGFREPQPILLIRGPGPRQKRTSQWNQDKQIRRRCRSSPINPHLRLPNEKNRRWLIIHQWQGGGARRPSRE